MSKKNTEITVVRRQLRSTLASPLIRPQLHLRLIL